MTKQHIVKYHGFKISIIGIKFYSLVFLTKYHILNSEFA